MPTRWPRRTRRTPSAAAAPPCAPRARNRVAASGGTRVGVKCLHAHLANFLVGAIDPVGELVAGEVELPELVIDDVRD